MKILFLDDSLTRHKMFRQNSIGHTVHQVYDAQDCLDKMRENEYDMVFLDHDLDEETINQVNEHEQNGSYVAKQMVRESLCKNSKIVIHSLNPDGRKNMMSILKSGGYCDVEEFPFAWTVIIGMKGST